MAKVTAGKRILPGRKPHKVFATKLLFTIFVSFMKNNTTWDTIGIGTSLACAVHCALLPLFLSSLPLFGINIINNLFFESGMILLALCIGSYALYHGYKKHHHSWLPLIVFFIGFFFLVLKQFFIEYENWLLIPAVTFIVSAHFFNFRFCRVHAHADDCDH
jgi:hypothetical protein